VFLAFALLLAMLRYARLRRVTAATSLADQTDPMPETEDTAIGLTPAPEDPVPGEIGETGEPADPDMPVFHRMWSSPTPPASST
jgi:hypothetical protein